MRARQRTRLAALAAVAALIAVVAVAIPGASLGLLFVAPALLLLAPLLLGRYVGEERVVALAVAARARLPRAASRLVARLPRAPRARVTGGRLVLLGGLAERGPPAPALCG